MAENFFESMVAAQMASGGQNVITPQNVNRIMSLAAQQEAQRRMAMASGRQAVEERKNLQQMQAGMTPGEIAGTTLVAPSGARFVTDAQGNVVGMNAPGTIPGPMALPGETEADAKRAFNRGEGTADERELFSKNFSGTGRDYGILRKTFVEEMGRAAPKPQAQTPTETQKTPFTDADMQGIMGKVQPRPWDTVLKSQTEERLGGPVNFGYGLPTTGQRELEANSADLYRARQEAMARGASKEQLKPIEDAIRSQYKMRMEMQDKGNRIPEKQARGLISEMENLYAEAGAPSQEVMSEDQQRADLYKELQGIERELAAGSRSMSVGQPFPVSVPLTPKMRSDLAKRQKQLREEIAKSGKRSSVAASKTAATPEQIAQYQLLQESLARATR